MKKQIPLENFGEKKFYFQTNFQDVEKAKAEDGGISGTIIRGYASTNDTDRTNDIIEPEAFANSIRGDYKQNPIVLFQHKYDEPIGKATSLEIDSKGLYIEAVIVDEKIEPKLQAGILKAFSVGFRPIKEIYKAADGRLLDPENWDDLEQIIWDGTVIRTIKEVELFEISVVSVPANATALFSLSKSVESYFDERKKLLQTKYNTMSKSKEQKQVEEEIKEGKDEDVKEEIKQENEKADEAETSDEAEKTEAEKVESQADETSGEGEGSETNADDEKTEAEKAEDDEADGELSDQEKSLGFQVTKKEVTKENLIVALTTIKTLTERVADLKSELDAVPANMALAAGEVFEAKGHEAKPEKVADGTIDGIGMKAWLNKKAGL